ncbi:MAG: GIY-YIG nuclease family protein [Gammaproteobacteria bacterium]|nr:GIY-YIG nuclease family protein [Gammaproteobacteria bacterium]
MNNLIDTNKYWYVYVILCEERILFSGITTNVDRRLKEQFSGDKHASKLLLKVKPLMPIKIIKCKNKKTAILKSGRINKLEGEQREDFILRSCLKKTKPLKVQAVSKDKFEITCNECSYISTLLCEQRKLEIELMKFKCIHETIKEKINTLFEQAILGAICFNNGRFMFEGKREDKARGFLLAFSERGHQKRTMTAYLILDEISFKNSYLLLSSILEESYYLIRKVANEYSNYRLHEKYTRFTFTKTYNSIMQDASGKIRFVKIAQFIQLIANVLKHSGGIIINKDSGKDLITYFKFKEDLDIVSGKSIINIYGIQIGDIIGVIEKLYVFIFDFIAFIFGFKKFRIKLTDNQSIQEKIVNYDIREAFQDFLKTVEQDGSVLFVDL